MLRTCRFIACNTIGATPGTDHGAYYNADMSGHHWAEVDVNVERGAAYALLFGLSADGVHRLHPRRLRHRLQRPHFDVPYTAISADLADDQHGDSGGPRRVDAYPCGA